MAAVITLNMQEPWTILDDCRTFLSFLDDVFREAEAEGPEAPIFDDHDAVRKDDAAAAAAAAHNARMALEGPAAPGIDRGAIREATEALRALGMSSAELRERS